MKALKRKTQSASSSQKKKIALNMKEEEEGGGELEEKILSNTEEPPSSVGAVIGTTPPEDELMKVHVEGRDIPVTVTNESQVVEKWVQQQRGKLFGLDLEWKPNTFKGENNKAAFLQLCGESGCLIIQLLYLNTMPSSLVDFLSDSEIKLAGVGIRNDAEKLEQDYHLKCNGLVELQTLAVQNLNKWNLKYGGLKSLAKEVLGLSIAKPKKVALSNWSLKGLNLSQIEYACIDACISFSIAQKLLKNLY